MNNSQPGCVTLFFSVNIFYLIDIEIIKHLVTSAIISVFYLVINDNIVLICQTKSTAADSIYWPIAKQKRQEVKPQ